MRMVLGDTRKAGKGIFRSFLRHKAADHEDAFALDVGTRAEALNIDATRTNVQLAFRATQRPDPAFEEFRRDDDALDCLKQPAVVAPDRPAFTQNIGVPSMKMDKQRY